MHLYIAIRCNLIGKEEEEDEKKLALSDNFAAQKQIVTY